MPPPYGGRGITRRLAIANRTRISVSVTETFGPKTLPPQAGSVVVTDLVKMFYLNTSQKEVTFIFTFNFANVDQFDIYSLLKS